MTLLFAIACQPQAPIDLGPGVHPVRATSPPLQVRTRPGESLAVGALSPDAEVELTATLPSGERLRAQSRRSEHRAANLRAAADGAIRVSVRAIAGSDPEASLVVRRPLSGSVCVQLEQLTAGDSWALEGVEHATHDDARRTRSLVAVMPWAHECTVNRLGGLDVGPSCRLSGVPREQAVQSYATVEADFRACHGGWTLTDESAGTTREWVAEGPGALHFLRLRDLGVQGWQVSTGAIAGP